MTETKRAYMGVTIRVILYLVIFVLLFINFISTVFASTEVLQVNKAIMANGTIIAELNASTEIEPIYTILSYYQNDTISDIEVIEMAGFIGIKTIERPYGDNCTSAKMFVVNQESLAPLCQQVELIDVSNTQYEVLFKDYNGEVLSSQEVRYGENARSPVSPDRPGYLFVGWDKDYTYVEEDLVISALYLDENASNIFILSDAEGSEGDEVTITLNLQGAVNVCAFETKLEYDPSDLEFVSCNSMVGPLDVVANHVEQDDSILLNYTSLSNRTNEAAVVTLTFRIKDSASHETYIKFVNDSIIAAYTDTDYNLYPTEYNCIYGKVWIR